MTWNRDFKTKNYGLVLFGAQIRKAHLTLWAKDSYQGLGTFETAVKPPYF